MEVAYLLPGQDRCVALPPQNGKKRVEYSYCTERGELFSCIASTVEADRICANNGCCGRSGIKIQLSSVIICFYIIIDKIPDRRVYQSPSGLFLCLNDCSRSGFLLFSGSP